jgi:hypothetical protein
MIGLLMHNARRPPLGLGLFRIASTSRSRSWRGLAAIVWMSHLLARLDELDEGLRDYAAVELLEVFQSTLIVLSDLLGLINAEIRCFIAPWRADFAM